MADLQVHRIQPRGQLGDDAAENQMALCASYRQKVHWQKHELYSPPLVIEKPER
jgi:hypothetical protein